MSDMEELIVLLIVSLQLFLFSICQFGPEANAAMCIVQDGLFTEGSARMDENLLLEGRQAATSKLTVLKMLFCCAESSYVLLLLFLTSLFVDFFLVFSVNTVNNLDYPQKNK